MYKLHFITMLYCLRFVRGLPCSFVYLCTSELCAIIVLYYEYQTKYSYNASYLTFIAWKNAEYGLDWDAWYDGFLSLFLSSLFSLHTV